MSVCRSCLHLYTRGRGAHNLSRGLPKKLPLAGVSNVILVASGKGGVGKSTIAANLAVSLSKRMSVGLLDADVFGPSQPRIMNLSGSPEVNHQNLMIPLVNYNVKCMSMGLLVDKQDPVVWRGLMVMQAIKKLLRGVRWGPLDTLVIDMPPGTGDTQLSITQEVPVTGVLLVSTPQHVAVEDAVKGAHMFSKVSVPILGVVENMSYFRCPCCNSQHPIFSSNLHDKLHDIEILGRLPLTPDIVSHCDKGTPSVLNNTEVEAVFEGLVDAILPALTLDG